MSGSLRVAMAVEILAGGAMRACRAGAAVAAVGLILSGGAVRAFEIDYGAVFAAHAGQVMQAEPGLRVLEMPGPVILHERRQADGQLSYDGEDQSGLGAVGCSLDILIELVAVVGLCEGMLSNDERHRLEAHLAAIAGFAGANAVPVVPPEEVRGRLVARLAGRIEDFKAEAGGQCPIAEDGRQDVIEIARNLARPGGSAAIERLLSLPRLPVMNPCM